MDTLTYTEREKFDAPWDKFFTWAGYVNRCNHPEAIDGYRKRWQGEDFYINMGRHKGMLLSQVTSTTWLTWALNHYSDGPSHLLRALKDQLNACHQ